MRDIVISEVTEESIDYFFDLQCNYDLEFCGESGRYIGYKWYRDDASDLNVYCK